MEAKPNESSIYLHFTAHFSKPILQFGELIQYFQCCGCQEWYMKYTRQVSPKHVGLLW